MNFKTTYVLFGLLVALFAVLGVALWLGPTKKPEGDYVFPSMKTKGDEVKESAFTRVEIESTRPAKSGLKLERGEGKSWRIVEPRPMPADAGSVNALLGAVMEAKVVRDLKPGSKKEAGLEKPARVVVLKTEEKTFRLRLGDSTPLKDDSVTYAESSDRPNELLAIKTASIRAALEPFAAFRGKELLGDTAALDRLKLTRGKATVEFRKDKEGWHYVVPAYSDPDLSTLLVNLPLLASMHDDKGSDFVKDEAPLSDLPNYGLDAKSDPIRIEAGREGGGKVVAFIGKKEGEKHFATLENDGKTRDIQKVPASAVESLTKLLDDPGSLRNKTLVKLEDAPDAIDIQGDYGLLEFRKPAGATAWTLWRKDAASKVDENEMKLLISALQKTDPETTFAEAGKRKELGLDKADATVVKVWSGALEKAEEGKKPAMKKDAAPAAVLRFGNKAGDRVAVERLVGKQSDLLMVAKIAREQAEKRPLDYMDRTIPPFNPGSAEQDVTKLEVERAGEAWEAEKGKDGWVFTRPAAWKGRKANADNVRAVLSELNRLTAREIESDKPEAKELAGWKLDKGDLRAKVTLTKEGKPTTHEFFVGRAKGDKGNYGRIAGNPAVYVFDPVVAETLKREPRDLTALAFDLGKVASVTLKGWKPLLGSVYTITAEKEGGKWAVKEPKGFDLAPEKLDKFLEGLASLKAEKFIAAGRKLKAEDGGFLAQITLSDKTVLELQVGDDEGGGYAATSSQLKGDVFTVPKELFASAREKPAHFGK
ncbi:MAG: DUF4340 domain-containing protein [Gemmataceae bacterium]|nr:DUF4340 domain-containing protein [Gemmataceae bacterium]